MPTLLSIAKTPAIGNDGPFQADSTGDMANNILITGLFRDRSNKARSPFANSAATSKLQIGASDIRFLCEPLLDGTRFERIVQNLYPHDIWQLTFFCQSRFEHRIYLVRHFINADQLSQAREQLFSVLLQVLNVSAADREIFDIGKMIWVEQNGLDEAAVKLVSQHLRGSHSLKTTDFVEQAGRFIALDARGIGMVAPDTYADLHARHAILLALARAYQNATTDANNELAKLVAQLNISDSNKLLARLYRDTLIFSARYYYARPVSLQTIDLHRIWQNISESNFLSAGHAELSEQLATVLGLLQHDDDKREQEREQRNQRWLSLIGILLALLSLLGLVTITPEALTSFWGAWFGS